MVDYSRAASSRAAKASFDKAAQSLISEIQELQAEYETEWKKVEDLRRSRASLIENVIPILKSNEVKLARPLSKCDNGELMEELSKTVNSLDTTPQEEVKVAMVRIESRYDQLVKQAKKLDALYERLSSYYVPEKDYDDEVVVSLKGRKKKKNEDKKQEVVVDENPKPEVEVIINDEIEMPVTAEAKDFLDHLDATGEEESLGEYFQDAQPSDVEVEVPMDKPTIEDAGDTPEDQQPEEEPQIDVEEAALDEVVDAPLDVPLDAVSDETGLDIDTEALDAYNNAADYNMDNLETIFQSSNLEEEYRDKPVDFQGNDLDGKYSEIPTDYQSDGYEQVLSATPASPELIEEVESLIDSRRLFDYLDQLYSNSDSVGDSKAVEVHNEEEPDFHTYSLNSNQTFSQIVDYVYEGNLTWYDIYRYADNEDVINNRCEELGIDIEDAANTPGALADIDIKYPKNFTPYEEKTVGYGKAA